MKNIITTLAAIIVFAACSKPKIVGSGPTITVNKTLPAFTGIATHADIKAEINYGTTQQVVLTGYQNLLNIIDARVIDGVLHIQYDPNTILVRNGNVKATITLPVLKQATIHGSSEIVIKQYNYADTFSATIHGSGSIWMENCNYTSALLGMYGSGNINAMGLQVAEARADMHGSGNIKISVGNKLTANIYGSGNIYYWGSPQTLVTDHGTGRVIKN